jgi:uncharacterized membrane protein
MPRPSHPSKAESFNFRVDATLKAAFTAATAGEDRPAAQVLRSFMRAYVARRERRAFAAEAHRQSVAAASAAADPTSDEAAVMRELEADLDTLQFGDEWR